MPEVALGWSCTADTYSSSIPAITPLRFCSSYYGFSMFLFLCKQNKLLPKTMFSINIMYRMTDYIMFSFVPLYMLGVILHYFNGSSKKGTLTIKSSTNTTGYIYVLKRIGDVKRTIIRPMVMST